MDNYLRGLAYEYDIKVLLLKVFKLVFLWNEIPLDIFLQSEFFKCYSDKLKLMRAIYYRDDGTHGVTDTGCDILYYNEELSKWIVVQCKNYMGTITLDKLAGFYAMLVHTRLNGELYYTSKLSEPIARYGSDTIKLINYPFKNLMNVRLANDPDQYEEKYVKLKLYPYQDDALKNLETEKRSVLSLPPGMGKTLISIHWVKRFEIAIILSPLKQHAQQNLTRFRNELSDSYNKFFLVDSDGTRIIDDFKYNQGDRIVLSATYKSADVIWDFIFNHTYTENIGIVIDEFHNLPTNIGSNEPMFNIFTQGFNYLFVSATPKTFYLNEHFSADDFTITGNLNYTYEFGKAIKDNHTCDYDVFVPDISLTHIEHLQDVYEHFELDLNTIDKSVIGCDAKAHFLLRSMEENGHAKCICYALSVEDTNNLKMAFEKIKEYHGTDLYIGIIVSHTSQKDRERILKEFSEVNKKAVIFSIRILDECIDIPKCDSVFITSRQTNKRRTIQRICRANRKDPMNPSKRSGIYMWTDSYDDMTELIANLKEIDSTFTNEKVKICNIRDNVKPCVMNRKDKENEKKYISMDLMVVKMKRVETWSEILKLAIDFLEAHENKPNTKSNDLNEKKLGKWISRQQTNYKRKSEIMKFEYVYNMWKDFSNKYKHLIATDEEKWMMMYDMAKDHYLENDRNPSIRLENEKTLSYWISDQRSNAKQRSGQMKYDHIYELWCKLVNDNIEHFLTNEERWKLSLINVKNYIDSEAKKPSGKSNDENIKKMGQWLHHQLINAKTKKGIFSSDENEMVELWNEFINDEKYKKYLLTYEEKWLLKCDDVKTYMIDNDHRPSKRSKDENVRELGRWLTNQIVTSKKRSHIMKSDEIYQKWIEFIEDDRFKKYFK